MESTAQYWKPVWGTLERYWKPICEAREGALATSGTLHLAQALSNRGRRGRKKDFRDAERLAKRLVAHELVLSFVPDVEQRLLRTVVRTKYQLTRNRVQLQNRLEGLLEEAHIKLSSLVSDLFGPSARRMLEAIADGETIKRLAEVPGLGVDSAQQVIAEVTATAATFPSGLQEQLCRTPTFFPLTYSSGEREKGSTLLAKGRGCGLRDSLFEMLLVRVGADVFSDVPRLQSKHPFRGKRLRVCLGVINGDVKTHRIVGEALIMLHKV